MRPNNCMFFGLTLYWLDDHLRHVCLANSATLGLPGCNVRKVGRQCDKLSGPNRFGRDAKYPTSSPPKKNVSSFWFQPIWNICASQNWIISPGSGVKIKKWNHHLGVGKEAIPATTYKVIRNRKNHELLGEPSPKTAMYKLQLCKPHIFLFKFLFQFTKRFKIEMLKFFPESYSSLVTCRNGVEILWTFWSRSVFKPWGYPT